MLHFLNNASQSQMQKLPSVGPKAGHSILSYRGLNGNFTDLENLKLVPGLRKNFYENFIKVNIKNIKKYLKIKLICYPKFFLG